MCSARPHPAILSFPPLLHRRDVGRAAYNLYRGGARFRRGTGRLVALTRWSMVIPPTALQRRTCFAQASTTRCVSRPLR